MNLPSLSVGAANTWPHSSYVVRLRSFLSWSSQPCKRPECSCSESKHAEKPYLKSKTPYSQPSATAEVVLASQVPHPPPRPCLLDRLLGAVLSKRGRLLRKMGSPHPRIASPSVRASVQERERSQERYRLVRVKQVLPDGSLYEGQIATAGPHGLVSSPSAWLCPAYGLASSALQSVSPMAGSQAGYLLPCQNTLKSISCLNAPHLLCAPRLMSAI